MSEVTLVSCFGFACFGFSELFPVGACAFVLPVPTLSSTVKDVDANHASSSCSPYDMLRCPYCWHCSCQYLPCVSTPVLNSSRALQMVTSVSSTFQPATVPPSGGPAAGAVQFYNPSQFAQVSRGCVSASNTTVEQVQVLVLLPQSGLLHVDC